MELDQNQYTNNSAQNCSINNINKKPPQDKRASSRKQSQNVERETNKQTR